MTIRSVYDHPALPAVDNRSARAVGLVVLAKLNAAVPAHLEATLEIGVDPDGLPLATAHIVRADELEAARLVAEGLGLTAEAPFRPKNGGACVHHHWVGQLDGWNVRLIALEWTTSC